MSKNFSDLIFRILFSLIFIGLGGEHLVDDEMILKVTPDWMALPRIGSILCGLLLLVGGGMIAIGYRLKWAAIALGSFLVIVTGLVHAPGISAITPPIVHPDDRWIWDTLQRSNFVKNLCLFGVCVMLPHYQIGDWSLEGILKRRKS